MADVIVDNDGYVPYHARCPKGHLVLQRHRAADWAAGLSNGRILFCCATCEEHWPPSLMDKAAILVASNCP